ncbi:DUF1617 family protein [Gracilibacillus saliphilus]|uniref:DUF1617 family protein n=1 Tax=Gracilibacillus saliphilus TaxID=543890 RepID=UPI0013D0545C|nr:DUF1617 family protein [Gracilibacillus saliphilus]
MYIEIENIKIADSIGVLEKLTLKGLKSIYRTRLATKLSEKLKRVAEEQEELRKQYCHLDKEGNPKVKEDGKLDVKDKEEFDKVMNEFFKEKIVIDDGDSQVMLKSVKKSLEESENEWSSREAYAFAYLYEAFKDDDNAAETEKDDE